VTGDETDPEPTRFRRAWSAWLDSDGDDGGATNRELSDALTELLTDALVEQAEEEDR
jgi:hypothetical protein